jgi:hypothetical protein
MAASFASTGETRRAHLANAPAPGGRTGTNINMPQEDSESRIFRIGSTILVRLQGIRAAARRHCRPPSPGVHEPPDPRK